MSRYHLAMPGSVTIDIADPSSESAATTAMPAGGVLLLQLSSSDIHDKPSTARAMPRAAAAVTRLAKAAKQAGASIALWPREACWMRRSEDAVRVAMRVNRGNVGVALSIDDWYATDGDEAMLPDRIKLLLPKLLVVMRSEDQERNERVLKLLKATGYAGTVSDL